MRYIIKVLLPLLTIGFVLNACKKQQTEVVVSTKNATNTLTASSTTIVLDSATKQATAVTFKWDSVNYNVRTTISYILQFDVASDAFKAPVSVTVGTNAYTLAYTDSALNVMAIKLGDTTSGAIQVRVLAYIAAGSDFYDTVYSNTVSITVTPYIIYVAPPPPSFLYVVGDFQGWTWPPSAGVNKADSLYSPTSNGKYSGFVMITDGTGSDQFKLLPGALPYSWNEAFANANPGMETTTGNVNAITMTTASGTANNLIVPQNGYYYMVADTNGLTLTSTLFTSVTASGTATGSTPITLAYDSTSRNWTASSVALSSGTLQFTINGTPSANNITFGQGASTNLLILGGSTGVPVSASGNYNIVLDLNLPQAYSDTLTKL